MPSSASSGAAGLHDHLRRATNDVHQRLHRHAAFAAIQNESIDHARYVALLRRLFGFHRPFEIAAGLAPERSQRLASDLAYLAGRALGASCVSDIPLCRNVPAFNEPDAILGAHYVVKGSALGGRGLARHLDTLLGAGAVAGRRFFADNGRDTGADWRRYLTRLACFPDDPAARQRVVAGATATFAAFETWVRDWDLAS